MSSIWPCSRVQAAITAAKQTAIHEVWKHALAHDDPAGTVTAFAEGAELVDITEDAMFLALSDQQLAAGLDQPHRVECLVDAVSGAYGIRLEVHVVNARAAHAAEVAPGTAEARVSGEPHLR